MASESSAAFSGALLSELRGLIAGRGIIRNASVSPADLPPSLAPLRGLALPEPPLAVAVDVYGTLLANAAGEVATAAGAAARGLGFPEETADRLRTIISEDHARSRAEGIPFPEVDAPSVFARALGLDREGGARACAAWECATNACAPMPGAAAFLASCAARGLPVGIVSNAQFYTPLFVEAAFGAPLHPRGGRVEPLGIDPDLAFWSFASGRAKPDRWMFDRLADRLGGKGIRPERILYVGNDALNDCAAAGEAGFMTALFGGDARSFKPRPADARVAAHPPSTVVLSWEELGSLVFGP